jgi:hypothetical protein
MNPFSAFLQPPTQRSPLAGAGEFIQGLQQQALQKRAQEFREKESGLDNARADSYLKLQQGQQARSFSDADKKEVESLLAEYQDAEDQGDPVRLSRASQMLKRFGMDVSPGGAPAAAPKLLPGMLPDPKAFTGTSPDQANPIGDAIATERASREALRGRTEAPDLSQEDFEADLIANPRSIPDAAPDAEEVIDLDAVDPTPIQIGGLPKVSAGTKDFPVPEGTVDGGDLDAVETTSAGPQAASSMAPGLAGGLPVRISKGGKQLYESTGPSGRWVPMVQGVFQAAAQHQDPEYAAAGKRAQQMATKLIGVDGIAPKDAIKFAADQLQNEIQNITNFRRTELGTRPKYGGGGAQSSGFATGALRGAQGALTDDAWKAIDATMVNYGVRALNATDNGLRNAQSGLNSDNPASQRGAIRNILKAMSGLTVNAKEEAGYERLAGLAEQAKNMLSQLTGDDMSPGYIAAVKQMLAEWRAESARIRDEAGRRAADAYVGLAPQAPPEVIQGQADTIYRYFQGAGGESKYKPPAERPQSSPAAGRPGYDPDLDG